MNVPVNGGTPNALTVLEKANVRNVRAINRFRKLSPLRYVGEPNQ